VCCTTQDSPYRKSYDELAATDAIGKDEFEAIVERMLMAAHPAGEEGQG
jgi:hypothetical protein